MNASTARALAASPWNPLSPDSPWIPLSPPRGPASGQNGPASGPRGGGGGGAVVLDGAISVAWLLEPRAISPLPYEYVLANAARFDFVFTHDAQTAAAIPNGRLYPLGTSLIPPEARGAPPLIRAPITISSLFVYGFW